MITKKQLILRCTALICGLVLGIFASYFAWSTKEYFTNPLNDASKINTDKLQKSNFWQKVTIHFEDQTFSFLDSYVSIYNSYNLSSDMDTKLIPYFDKYGYTSMLVSGLRSDSKLANIYCIEKCCELYGEKTFDTKEVLSALKNVKIDKTIITDDENESTYIHIAQERLDLALSLLDESYSSSKIIKNSQKTRMAWISNLMNSDNSLRIYDFGFIYTTLNTFSTKNSAFRFISDDTILLNDGYTHMVIIIGSSVGEYVINDIINDKLKEEYNKLHITSVNVSNGVITASFTTETTADHSFLINKYTITYHTDDKSASVIKTA